MRKIAFIALLSLLLPIASLQPAVAGREVAVANDTPYTVTGFIEYGTYLCKNDHPTIAPGTTWRNGIGLCLTKTVKFRANGHDCELMGGRPGNPKSFVVKKGSAFGYRDLYCGFTAR